MRRGLRALAIGAMLPFAIQCHPVIGPSCLSRQQRGTVTSLGGTVAAGTVVAIEVPYATEGSQNDVSISWINQRVAGGPRIHVYATRLDCTEYGACPTLGSRGGVLAPDARACAIAQTCAPDDRDIVQTSLTIPSGRGNPDVIGPTARYKVWIVGDTTQDAVYNINITWFFGPDC
jgi:hypothetical protein